MPKVKGVFVGDEAQEVLSEMTSDDGIFGKNNHGRNFDRAKQEEATAFTFYASVLGEVIEHESERFKLCVNPTFVMDVYDKWGQMMDMMEEFSVTDVVAAVVGRNESDDGPFDDLGGVQTDRVFSTEKLVKKWIEENGWKIRDNVPILKLGHRTSANWLLIPVQPTC